MEKFLQEGGIDVPQIEMDPREGLFEIKGRSFPEDTVGVYMPVIDWIDQYSNNAAEKTKLTFELDYFNSSTYKAFLNILLRLEKIQEQAKSVSVIWRYNERDLDMKEAGEEFAELVDIPFSFVAR